MTARELIREGSNKERECEFFSRKQTTICILVKQTIKSKNMVRRPFLVKSLINSTQKNSLLLRLLFLGMRNAKRAFFELFSSHKQSSKRRPRE